MDKFCRICGETVYTAAPTLELSKKSTGPACPDKNFIYPENYEDQYMPRKYLLKSLLILCLITTATLAQPATVLISGKVTDYVSEAELSGATVDITNLGNGQTGSVQTNTSGYWEFDLATSISDPGNIPEAFSVSDPYPNPFNPSTSIEFNLPTSGQVKITVFDILGKVIDVRESGLRAGSYSVAWEGRGAAGIYFINIRTGIRSVTKKITQLDGLNGSGLSDFRPGNRHSGRLSKTPATTDIRLIISKFGYLPDTMIVAVGGGEYFESVIKTLHSQCDLFDMHNDILERIYYTDPTYHLGTYHTYFNTDIPRLRLGGVDYQFFVAWVDPDVNAPYFQSALDMIDIFKSELALNPADIAQARTAGEALALKAENKISAILVVEGGHAIEDDMSKLDSLYNLGMRYLTITWNNSTDWAVSAKDSRSATVGLSDFGKQVIRHLDSLGVLIDVSHTGIKTIEDILATSKNPIIASHSGARALHDHYRNLYDDQITAIANTGGVIGVVFYYPFLSGNSKSIQQVVDHIDYIKNLVGIDHVALGSDFDGIGNSLITGLEDVSKFPNLTLELLKKGYSREDIEKILGGNCMRVFNQVCKN
jgi:membrane dipeptidase